MPLRVLLLLPDGEQPSVLRASGHASSVKTPKTPTVSTLRRSPSPLSGFASPSSSDYRSKPLPSPPPTTTVSRESNQTHLTLPSTSGSSAGSSSRSTEYVPSPPLSPSPTDSFADITVRALKLNPNKRGKPVLAINTKLPRIGKGVRYISSSQRGSERGDGSCDDSASDDEDGVEAMGMYASTSHQNDNGLATARKAVDDRLQHLLSITQAGLFSNEPSHSPLKIPSSLWLSSASPTSHIPSSPLPHSPLDTQKRLHMHPILPSVNIALQNSQSHYHNNPSRPKQYRHTNLRGLKQYAHARRSNPPSAPTRALPPYKIFGTHDIVPLDVISDPRRARRIPLRKKEDGWGRTGVLIQSTRAMKPKSVKGRYIRLVTSPPLPPNAGVKAELGDGADDEVLDAILSGFVGNGRGRKKGRMPTILVDPDDEGDEAGENGHAGSKATSTTNEVPIVYMTELVATQWDHPVTCMMWPPPTLSSTSSTSLSSRPAPFISTRPISALSNVSTVTSIVTQIISPQTSTYQLPLPNLTPLQKLSLHKAGLLVYAVPQGYTGSIPPPQCLWIGEHVKTVEEEIVGPWATAQVSTLHSLQTLSREGSVSGGSPRASMLGLTSPPRSPLSGNSIAANGAAGGVPLSGSLSPRWPVEGLGLWSRAKVVGGKQSSGAVPSSAAESPVASRPTSAVMGSRVEDDGAEKGGGTTAEGASITLGVAGWSSSFSSIRARAQGYYAKDTASANPAQASTSPETGLSTSKSETISTAFSKDLSSVPMSRVTSNTMGASRSFGSLFLRTTSSTTTSNSTNSSDSPGGVTTSTGGLTIPDSGYASSPATGKGEVLFDYVEPPRDGEVVKVEIIEAEGGSTTGNGNGVAVTAKGWKLGGWGARWGG